MRETSSKNKLLACVGIFVVALLFTANGAFAYTTPGTGVTYSMDDLVTNSGGDITGAGGSYTMGNDLTISAGDTARMTAGDTLTVTAGTYGIYVEGTLSAAGEDGNPITFTNSTTTTGDWHGIYVSGDGTVNLAYCDIMYSADGIWFEEVASSAPPSAISQCNISNNGFGIYANSFNAASLAISNSEISLNENEGIYLSYVGNSEVAIDGNTINQNGYDGFFLEYGGENVTLSGNTITDNGGIGVVVSAGGWNIAILNNTITGNNDGIILNYDGYTGGDNAVITGNTISDNGEFGIWSYYSVGHTIENNTVSGHTSTGIHLESSWNELVRDNTVTGNSDGIYVEGGIAGRSASSADYEWIEVNVNNADDWNIEQDDDCLDEAGIGFDFTLGDTTYTHFQVQTNGSLELATGSGLTNGISDYEGRGYITQSYPDSTVIFVNNDDWYYGESGDEPYETHNSVSVRMDGWGYKHFNAGDTDGDGNTVSEECLVLRWYMTMISDDTPYSWNDFEVVLYPDGRVRWNTRAMDGTYPELSQYSGIYAGANTTPFEVTAGSGTRTQSSYLYDPASTTDISTRIYANTIENNTGYGLLFYETVSQQIRGNEIVGNSEGIVLAETGYASTDNTIEYNNIYDNTTLDLANYQDEAVTAENNYWALQTAMEIDGVVYDDDEDGTLGAVDFDPFLASPVVPPVASAGDDQTADEGDSVTLNGSVSDASLVASYSWEQTAGTAASLSDASAVAPTFTAPDVCSDETLTFMLTVTDTCGIETTDECNVMVTNVVADTPTTDTPTTDIPTSFSSGGNGGLCFIGDLMD